MQHPSPWKCGSRKHKQAHKPWECVNSLPSTLLFLLPERCVGALRRCFRWDGYDLLSCRAKRFSESGASLSIGAMKALLTPSTLCTRQRHYSSHQQARETGLFYLLPIHSYSFARWPFACPNTLPMSLSEPDTLLFSMGFRLYSASSQPRLVRNWQLTAVPFLLSAEYAHATVWPYGGSQDRGAGSAALRTSPLSPQPIHIHGRVNAGFSRDDVARSAQRHAEANLYATTV